MSQNESHRGHAAKQNARKSITDGRGHTPTAEATTTGTEYSPPEYMTKAS